MPINRIELATRVAWSYHNMPYIWGGDDPMHGFDCSGMCISLLKSSGLLPRGGDWRAKDLYKKFEDKDDIMLENTVPKEGYLVFWHSSYNCTNIIHVEYCLDEVFSIGASGGGSENLTVKDAIKNNAYIKIRPFRSRSHIYGFVDPFKEWR